MCCVVWPTSGGWYFLHVPMGVYQQGWCSLLDMLKSFAERKELFDKQTPKFQGIISAQGTEATSYSHFPEDYIASYAKIVKKKAWSSSPLLPMAKESTSCDKISQITKSTVLLPGKQGKESFWVQKNYEVFQEDFSNLWIISRLFVFNDWREIAICLENHLKTKVIINLLFADNVLIEVYQGSLENLIENPCKWQEFGPFHFLI